MLAIFFTLTLAGACAQRLPVETFLQKVRDEHPMALQADLLDEKAQASLLLARGGFDPKLYGEWERKSFDQKNYFSIGEGGVKLPTWWGIEGKASYGYANGGFLNPERKLPAEGQAALGLSLPLLQGLLMDERRANLLQARILRRSNEAERRQMLNDLLLDASIAYWDWALAHAWQQTYQQAVQVAAQRLDAIRESWRLGDRPAIDTLEALIALQDRQMELQNARVLLQNATLQMGIFSWEAGKPVPLDPSLRPDSLALLPSVAPPALAADSLTAAHPLVRWYMLKLESLEVERRLKAEQLKPRLDLSYQVLSQGGDFAPEGGSLFLDNHKWGLSVGFPLLLRKQRGSLQLSELKILETEYALSQKRVEIENKIIAHLNELRNLRQQITLALEVQANYARLLAGENERFAVGESSLFLVNSRETKLIEATLKTAKFQAEHRKAEAKLRWASGRLQ